MTCPVIGIVHIRLVSGLEAGLPMPPPWLEFDLSRGT